MTVAENNDEFVDESQSDTADAIAEDVAEAGDGGGPNEDPVAIHQAVQEANDRVLRAQAELENFRKRARRELDDQLQYANLSLMAELLPSLDNLSRAVEAAEKHEHASGLLEGVKMVASQILATLAKHHCRPIDAQGKPFDPNVHEAIMQESSEEVPAGSVTRVLSVGYQLHDRVIRPSQVMVSTGPATDSSDSKQTASD